MGSGGGGDGGCFWQKRRSGCILSNIVFRQRSRSLLEGRAVHFKRERTGREVARARRAGLLSSGETERLRRPGRAPDVVDTAGGLTSSPFGRQNLSDLSPVAPPPCQDPHFLSPVRTAREQLRTEPLSLAKGRRRKTGTGRACWYKRTTLCPKVRLR